MTAMPPGPPPESSADLPTEERPGDEELLRDDLDDLAGELVAEQGSTVETGHPAVDEVLRSLDALDSEPVDGHVAVFEQAHEQLRSTLSGTLSGAGDDQV